MLQTRCLATETDLTSYWGIPPGSTAGESMWTCPGSCPTSARPCSDPSRPPPGCPPRPPCPSACHGCQVGPRLSPASCSSLPSPASLHPLAPFSPSPLSSYPPITDLFTLRFRRNSLRISGPHYAFKPTEQILSFFQNKCLVS